MTLWAYADCLHGYEAKKPGKLGAEHAGALIVFSSSQLLDGPHRYVVRQIKDQSVTFPLFQVGRVASRFVF
jgi:hypothetical protein